MLKKLALATGAFGLIALPAQAVTRPDAPTSHSEGLQGQGNLFFLLAIAVVAAAVVILPDSPTSP